jgi:nucleoside-diphosphate-sugar epimerase
MRIAITGAGGRLGRAVTGLAHAKGHVVVAIDRQPMVPPRHGRTFVRTADITDYRDVEAAVADCDALVHLAAYPGPDAAREPAVHNNNVVASYNALRAAQAGGIRRVCLASSVNAIGGRFSGQPRYDYFPVDELHPCYAEDSYSLSKRIAEEQAAAFGRRVPGMSIGCLRLHALREPDETVDGASAGHKDLWGYTPLAMAARACLAAVRTDLGGCAIFHVVAADTCSPRPSMELRDRYFPDVPVRGDLSGRRSFFDSAKAGETLLR